MASGVKDIFLDAQVYYPVTVERVCSAHKAAVARPDGRPATGSGRCRFAAGQAASTMAVVMTVADELQVVQICEELVQRHILRCRCG